MSTRTPRLLPARGVPPADPPARVVRSEGAHHAESTRRPRRGHTPTGAARTPPIAPLPAALHRSRGAQFVFDFNAVKGLLGDDRGFALEILVRRTCESSSGFSADARQGPG